MYNQVLILITKVTALHWFSSTDFKGLLLKGELDLPSCQMGLFCVFEFKRAGYSSPVLVHARKEEGIGNTEVDILIISIYRHTKPNPEIIGPESSFSIPHKKLVKLMALMFLRHFLYWWPMWLLLFQIYSILSHVRDVLALAIDFSRIAYKVILASLPRNDVIDLDSASTYEHKDLYICG